MSEKERTAHFAGADPPGSARMVADEGRVFARRVRDDAASAQEHVFSEGAAGALCLYVLAPATVHGAGADRLGALLAPLVTDARIGRVAVNRVTSGTATVNAIGEVWIRQGSSLVPFLAFADDLAAQLGVRMPDARAYLTSVTHSYGVLFPRPLGPIR